MGKPVRTHGASERHQSHSTRTTPDSKGAAKGKDRNPAKWLHHSLKTIHRALKQAKNFEIRKVTRRLAQARKEVDKKQQQPAGPDAVAKLQLQLQAAKQADLDKLAQQAAARAGLVINTSEAAAVRAAQVAAGSDAVAAAVHQRLMSATCVQKQVGEQLTEFKRRFASIQQEQQKPHATAAEADDGELDEQAVGHVSKRQRKLSAAEAGAAYDDKSGPSTAAAAAAHRPHDSDDSGLIEPDADSGSGTSDEYQGDEALSSSDADDGGNSSSSIDLEAEYEAQQQQQQQDGECPPDDCELDAVTLAALDKLRHRSAAAEATHADALTSEDSGVITDTDDAEMSDMDSRDKQQQQQSQQSKQQQLKGVKYPPPPPQQHLSQAEKLQLKKRQKLEKLLKRGKRIGQRMRRQLYEKLYGREANHLKGQQGTQSVGRHQQAGADGRFGARGSIGKERQQQKAAGRQQQQQQQQRDRPRPESSKQPPQQQESLHPSWAARKQQQKPVLAGPGATPAATKVVFGDDGQTVVTRSPPTARQQGEPRVQRQVPDKQPVYPSKQQKVVISSGPQVVKSAKSAASSVKKGAGGGQQVEQLHPSWQAKKQQQAVITAQPMGKKTVFGDD